MLFFCFINKDNAYEVCVTMESWNSNSLQRKHKCSWNNRNLGVKESSIQGGQWTSPEISLLGPHILSFLLPLIFLRQGSIKARIFPLLMWFQKMNEFGNRKREKVRVCICMVYAIMHMHAHLHTHTHSMCYLKGKKKINQALP